MRHFFAAFCAFLIMPCLRFGVHAQEQTLQPPAAKIIPHKLEKHGHVRTDQYYWMKDRNDPAVLDYLKKENEYTAQMMAGTGPLRQILFDEFKERIKQSDMTLPYKRDDYYYYIRYEEGRDYPMYCRKKVSGDTSESVILDVNAVAAGHGFASAYQGDISFQQDLMAYPVDTTGRRFYSIHFRNLTTGRDLSDILPMVTGNGVWANDNKTFFYTKQDPVTLRPWRVYRHVLGTDPAADPLVYEEKDSTFSCYVQKSKSKKYIMIISSQTLSTEYRYCPADQPEGNFTVFQPREKDHEYSVDHFGDDFYIRTNWGARNFRLMKTPVSNTEKTGWKEVIPHREDVLIEGFEMFRDYLALEERREGLINIRIRPWDGSAEHYIDFGEPAYVAYAGVNYDFNTDVLRYEYQSLTTPRTVYDYNMKTRDKKLMKRQEVLGGFDSGNYIAERVYAKARDGAKVPVSLVYRKGLKKDGRNPLLLNGYGSYGYSSDAFFSPFRVSLLDRGFVVAIAHIRGGQELGRSWYENGKLLKKKNTFYDFIDCGEYLINEKFAARDKLFAAGGSAGGLLIGAVINLRPDLFRGVIAGVPFVDVITTMLDESIPLTTSEYDEWGNPNDKTYYDYMLSYSPYDNVEKKDYPNILVTTSWHDSQVQYWEPAKWVARLRAMKTDQNRLFLKTEMEAGHGGVSGRYRQYKDIAFEYAFYLDILGITK